MTAFGAKIWHQGHQNVLCQLQVLHNVKRTVQHNGKYVIPTYIKIQGIVNESKFKALSPSELKAIFLNQLFQYIPLR